MELLMFLRIDQLQVELPQPTKGPCEVTIAYHGNSTPSAMDPGFQAALEEAAQRHASGLYQKMHSTAGHDAQVAAG
jgi:N-carbamoyl-L-amino-acid hydrolase